ncbi:MAG TPA: glucokinase, partial [Xanthomonadales bacterium]|nr:glucokinase [Xanthomonadales bacterium]
SRQAGISSFSDFWAFFQNQASAELADVAAFDAVSLAVAGPVSGRSAKLTNINWNILEEETRSFNKLFLLNDFLAQGHALKVAEVFDRMEVIRSGETLETGVIALVGAGTGLGHCTLHPFGSGTNEQATFQVASSEAGHAGFPLSGPQERELQKTWLRRLDKKYLSNDDVVSGKGVVNLHACLTGNSVSAAEALSDPDSETSELFSRFYARACRNFCLNVFPVRCLVISGGVAARNPHLIRSRHFMESFNDAENYRELMGRIPILLNVDQRLGIRGAAVFAASELLETFD